MISGDGVWWLAATCGSSSESVWVAHGGPVETRETLVVVRGCVSDGGALQRQWRVAERDYPVTGIHQPVAAGESSYGTPVEPNLF